MCDFFLDISVSKNHVSLPTAIRLNKTMNQEWYRTMLFYSTKLRQQNNFENDITSK